MARVLIIDDCDEFREVTQELLEDLGYVVFTAGTIEKGHELCEYAAIDIVLCDLVMPLCPGDEWFGGDSATVGLYAIHSISTRYPEIPIVAMSGQMATQPLRAIKNFGAVDSLTKPFGRENLLRVMQGALRRRAEQAALV